MADRYTTKTLLQSGPGPTVWPKEDGAFSLELFFYFCPIRYDVEVSPV